MTDDEIIKQYRRKVYDLGYRPYILNDIEFMIHQRDFENVLAKHHDTLKLLTEKPERIEELGVPVFIDIHNINGTDRLMVE